MKIKNISLFFIYLSILFFFSDTTAQVIKPISWEYDIKNRASKYRVGDSLTLGFKANIETPWYLFSSDFDPDLGPIVTQFIFNKDKSLTLLGDIIPIDPKKKYDEIWDGEYTYFKEKAAFEQKIILRSNITQIAGTITYQVCNELDGKCIYLEEYFSIDSIFVEGDAIDVDENIKNTSMEEDSQAFTDEFVGSREKISLWSFALIAFLSGIVAIFTPCVFPMLPITISFFQKKKKIQSLIYGISIIFIYTIIGVFMSLVLGPSWANFLSTHWLPNILFFSIFLIFAFSLLGAFDLMIPSHWFTKIDVASRKGGGIGSFFMAFTLVLVSFSCTGPIVGAILVESAGGSILKPIVGMLGFSLAFALPFSIFAYFPSLLLNMPKSGEWMVGIKVTLGFIELALSLKFLSIIDQVYHLGILDRHIFIALWIVIISFLGLYYLKVIRFSGEEGGKRNITIPKLLLSIVCFTFVVYLIPGMFGAPLQGLSGYLPPQTSHGNDLWAVIREYNTERKSPIKNVKYRDKFKLPHNLTGYFDYHEALEASKKQKKPIFIDFTGHGCVNCRKMEDNVWGNKEVLERLMNEYIVVALYVDDRTLLPEEEWITSAYDKRIKKTIGEVNSDIQITKFNNNAQPYYVLLDENQTLLAFPTAYDLNIQNFISFLDKGLQAYKNKK